MELVTGWLAGWLVTDSAASCLAVAHESDRQTVGTNGATYMRQVTENGIICSSGCPLLGPLSATYSLPIGCQFSLASFPQLRSNFPLPSANGNHRHSIVFLVFSSTKSTPDTIHARQNSQWKPSGDEPPTAKQKPLSLARSLYNHQHILILSIYYTLDHRAQLATLQLWPLLQFQPSKLVYSSFVRGTSELMCSCSPSV